MKIKLTFLSIAIAALLGVGMLMAFKQEEKHKQYLTISFLEKDVIIVDEKGLVEERKLSDRIVNKHAYIYITKELNLISAKGYKLISTGSITPGAFVGLTYTFEKE
ncbi:MAG: hypothetical protein V4658_10700 [Bacteroidota bacterium]